MLWFIIGLVLIIVLLLVLFFYPKKETSNNNYSKNITAIMNYHAQSHRNLLLETIGQFQNRDQTYQDMIKIDRQLRPYLISKYGLTVSNNIISLLEKKDEILSAYYFNLTKSYCGDGVCVKVETSGEKTSNKLNNLDNFIVQYGTEIIENVRNNLNELNAQITTLLKFEKDLETDLGTKFEILLKLYDQEIINQAKSYVFKDFENSMNHSRGSYEVSYNLAEHLAKIIDYES